MKLKFLSLYLLFMIQTTAQTNEINIIPAPQKLDFSEGKFEFSEKIFCSIESGIELRGGLSILETALAEKKIYLGVNPRGVNPMTIHFNLFEQTPREFSNLKEEIKNQSYLINIESEEIFVQSFTSVGAYYACITLAQMFEHAKSNFLPLLKIHDYPDLAQRGISDDISRGQVSTLANFKRIIEHLARYKMNLYIPYIEDVLEFEKYPSIGKNRGALTKVEVKEIIKFAGDHFIDVIPAFQTLGHYENILSQEEFLKYAEFPGAASLCVSDDSVYVFLENLLKEVFELFPSKYFHIGADESYDVGLGRSKFLLEKNSLGEIHAAHYKKVYDICKKYGKEVLMYGDIILQHPELLSLVPKDVTIVDWHYRSDDNYPSIKKIHDFGFNYFISPSVWNFLTTFPTNINALPNIQYIIREGIKHEAAGMINSNWGDYGAETFKELVLYGYAWSAQCSWNYDQSASANFSANYFNDFFGIEDSRFSYIYETFAHPFNQIMWHDVWRHPALPFREAAWWEPKISPVAKISWSALTMPHAHKLVGELELLVTKNKDHFEIIKFLVEFNHWYSLKLETQLLLQRFSSLDESDRLNLVALIDQNLSKLNLLKNNYKNIWLKYYKPSNLIMIEDKFDRLIAYFEEVKSDITNNDSVTSPLLASDWLYIQNSDSSFARKGIFSAELNLEILPDAAQLQFMADTYMKIYINEKYVDHLHARRSLSIGVEYKRIKFFDAKPYLKKGRNVFRFEVENFNRKGGAGLNLIGEIKAKDQIQKIESRVDGGVLRWSANTEEGTASLVSENSKNKFIIAPNFKSKRMSWIER